MTTDDVAPISRRSDAERIQWLIDREEIREALMLYCRGVDRRDEGLMLDAYHPDAYDDHGNFTGGSEALVSKVLSDPVDSVQSSMVHLVGNISIDLEGDVANVESYFVAYVTHQKSDGEYTSARGGRYLDHFERRDGQWRVAQRMVVDDWCRMDKVVGKPEFGLNTGLRTAADPVYSFFAEHPVR